MPSPVPTIGGRGAGLVVGGAGLVVGGAGAVVGTSLVVGAGFVVVVVGASVVVVGASVVGGGSGRLHGWRQIVPRSVGVPDAAVTHAGSTQRFSAVRAVPEDHCNG